MLPKLKLTMLLYYWNLIGHYRSHTPFTPSILITWPMRRDYAWVFHAAILLWSSKVVTFCRSLVWRLARLLVGELKDLCTHIYICTFINHWWAGCDFEIFKRFLNAFNINHCQVEPWHWPWMVLLVLEFSSLYKLVGEKKNSGNSGVDPFMKLPHIHRISTVSTINAESIDYSQQRRNISTVLPIQEIK